MTRLLLPLLTLAACEPLPDEVEAPDPAPVDEAWRAVQPGPLLDLTDALRALSADAPMDAGDGCPLVEALEEEGGTRETWIGCALPDGGVLDGALVWGDAEDSEDSDAEDEGSDWIAG